MVTVRDGIESDAAELAAMISDFNIEEGSPGRITTDGVTDLCFGDDPLYTPIVAEEGGKLIGYALIMRYFDTEPCAWCSYMQDLYVMADQRSRGIGKRLVIAAARMTRALGRHYLFWHVRERNHRGRAFYAGIGGQEQTSLAVILSGDALERLVEQGR